MNARRVLFAAALAAAALAACSRQPLSGPPELRLGRDECGECGMLISEDRCSSAVLIVRDGAREHVLFDDIGCMLVYEDSGEHPVPVESFVHDYASGSWVAAPQASYLVADRGALSTPMASGIVAFASEEGAYALQKRVGGQVVSLSGLRDARDQPRSAPPVPTPDR